MKILKTLTVLGTILAFTPSNATEIVRTGDIQEIKCENVKLRSGESLSDDLCNSFKNSGLAKLNRDYVKLLSSPDGTKPIKLKPNSVKFYTEDGKLFTTGNPHMFFKFTGKDYDYSQFVIKFDVPIDPPVDPILIDPQPPITVSEPAKYSLLAFLCCVLVLISLRRK